MIRYFFIFAALLIVVVGCKDDGTNEDACPDGIIYNDCSLGGACGDPTTASKCVGDVLLYCRVPTDPCWRGSQKFEKDCAASGLRCFSAEENGCGGRCLPVTDSEPDELPDDDVFLSDI
ncbi:MAG TPA: hypothetical protein P5077_10370 [bacterium]|nr:hypothetical protein [bacterium]